MSSVHRQPTAPKPRRKSSAPRPTPSSKPLPEKLLLGLIGLLFVTILLSLGWRYLQSESTPGDRSKADRELPANTTKTPESTVTTKREQEVTSTTESSLDPAALRQELIREDFDPHVVVSEAYQLVDVETGLSLAAKNPTLRLAPASLTKVMTALLAIEQVPDLDRVVQIKAEDVEDLYAMNASVAGFPIGAEVTVRDLLYGVLLPSGADACHALVRELAGSEAAWIELMNQRAAALGMQNTHFTNSTGLPDPDLYSTAADMAKLFLAAYHLPTFREIAGSDYHEVANIGAEGEPLALVSTFFWKFNAAENYRTQVTAGKSGFTGEEQCQVTCFVKNQREYILVTLGAQTEDPNSQQAVADQLVLMNELVKD